MIGIQNSVRFFLLCLFAFSLSCSSGGAVSAVTSYLEGQVTRDAAGTVYKVTSESNPQQLGLTYYTSTSADNGKTWSKQGRITPLDGQRAWAVELAACNTGNLYIAWLSQDIFVASSKDGGKTWGAAVKVNDSSSRGSYPLIRASSGGVVCVAWRGQDGIWTSISADSGKTWGKSAKQPGGGYVSLASSDRDGTFYLGYLDPDGDTYCLVHSADKGASWHTEKTDAAETMLEPRIFCTGSAVYLVGKALDISNLPVVGRNYSNMIIIATWDKGKTWSAPQVVDSRNYK